MTGKALIKVLKANGWLLGRIKGSHRKDLPKGLVKAILTQAEREEGMK
jgi:predicted RNA binding protein YcfA (HicA-like mRNA interferase family)